MGLSAPTLGESRRCGVLGFRRFCLWEFMELKVQGFLFEGPVGMIPFNK